MKNSFFILILVSFGFACKQSSSKASAVAPAPVVTPPLPPDNLIPTEGLDPLYLHAWHLENNGQAAFSTSGGLSGVDLNFGSQPANGEGIWIAVSDSGVEKNHEDLQANFNLDLSKNYSLASPWFGDPSPGQNAHGTAVSGIIAATKENAKGSYGVAYGATFVGLKYIGPASTVSKMVDQANGSYDIFNYSYGGYSCHFDHSSSVYLAQLEYGVTNLRFGLGAIYVKAAGNEYISHSSDCDSSIESTEAKYYLGNANLEDVHSYPWTIVTGAVNADGISSSYSTPGSSLWISAFGGEYGTDSPAIITTDLMGCDRGYAKSSSDGNDFEKGSSDNPNCDYTSIMNGTSSATPMISGVVALLLQTNPQLSWRDVKHILAKTARKIDASRVNMSHPYSLDLPEHIYDKGWITNSAGYHFHNWYGFGLVDVDAAISMATNYVSNLGIFTTTQAQSSANLNLPIPDVSSVGVQNSLSITSSLTIEAVQLKLDITHPYIGDLGIQITSPSGTTSTVMNINSMVDVEDIANEVLLSNAFYGENSQGTWQLKIIDGYSQDIGQLSQWSLKIFGH